MKISEQLKLEKNEKPVLAGAELPEIFSRFGGDVGEKLHLNATGGDGADGDVEEDNRVFRVWRPLMPLHRRIPGSRRHLNFSPFRFPLLLTARVSSSKLKVYLKRSE